MARGFNRPNWGEHNLFNDNAKPVEEVSVETVTAELYEKPVEAPVVNLVPQEAEQEIVEITTDDKVVVENEGVEDGE